MDSSGHMWAKGVISGGSHLGGSGSCDIYFAEITDAVNALPGDVATS
ncbi:hypothetical protein [Streptomyces sp. NPDC005955]